MRNMPTMALRQSSRSGRAVEASELVRGLNRGREFPYLGL